MACAGNRAAAVARRRVRAGRGVAPYGVAPTVTLLRGSAPCTETTTSLHAWMRHGPRPQRIAGAARAVADSGSARTVFRSDSRFSPFVAVVEFDDSIEEFGNFAGARILVLDNTPTAHSIWRSGEVVTHGAAVAGLPLIDRPRARCAADSLSTAETS